MSRINIESRKGNRVVYRPVLNVSRVFYSKEDAEAWIVEAQDLLKRVYFAGPALPESSPLGGRRQVGPSGSRLRDTGKRRSG